MTLLSWELYIALAVILAAYYLLAGKWQWVLLLLASLAFFLVFGTPYTICYLLASIVSAYAAGRIISDGRSGAKRRKAALIVAITVNVGMLAALKYADFFVANAAGLAGLFGADISYRATGWIASIGISFYTLQIIGYLCDVYWGISDVQKNPLKLALFAGYFPQMTSGPVSRYSQLESQLYSRHVFDFKAVAFGAQRILWGFAKKLIVAERIAPFVNTVYGDTVAHRGLVWAAAMAFTVQLYADFSGSMDIIMGITECFGIKLPANFKNPFFSRTVREFWQRWHITLGTWFKDYVMFPVLKSELWRSMGRQLKKNLGKSTAWKAAAAQIPASLGMLVLWVCIGIWHGGGWNFIFQGLWFWAVITLGQICAPLLTYIARKAGAHSISGGFLLRAWHIIKHLLQSARTYILFSIGLIFFRAGSLGDAFGLLSNAAADADLAAIFDDYFVEIAGGRVNLSIIAAGIAVMLAVEVLQYRGHGIRETVAGMNIAVRWLIYYALIFSVILWGMYGSGYNPADFIYGGF